MSQRQSFTEFIKCLFILQLLKSGDLLRESGDIIGRLREYERLIVLLGPVHL